MTGPYDTPSQARGAAAQPCRDQPYVPLRHCAHRLLTTAIQGSGMRVGTYDRDVLLWLAAAEPDIAVVVAGLITRAHQAGRDTRP